MDLKILIINAGSSTYKCSLFQCKKKGSDISPTFTLLWEDIIEFENQKDIESSLKQKFLSLWEGNHTLIKDSSEIKIVGHRVVNGGESLFQPTIVTPQVKQTIRELIPLAPLHNPSNLEGIELMEKLIPHAKQLAVFDTAFHHQLPEKVATYPIPYAWRKKGIRRYGFHGISHQYCTKRASELLKRNDLKIVCCHLGNGSSLAAVDQGHCINTTMGFTPLEGLMMGTRSGSIDPGILLYLLKDKGFSADDLNRLLNDESGCKGICGTQDMREITNRSHNGDKLAQLALDMYTERLKMTISAMIASLSGIDVLIFTAGIGENSSKIRSDTCKSLTFAGIQLDEDKNKQPEPDTDISLAGSAVRILVIHTREDFAIAHECYKAVVV